MLWFLKKFTLRNESQTTYRDKFIERWRWALRSSGSRTYWEGRQAYNDLKRTGYLERVRLEEGSDKDKEGVGLDHFIAQHALPKICAELGKYKKYQHWVREFIAVQEGHAQFLETVAQKLRKKVDRLRQTEPELASGLTDVATHLDGIRMDIHRRLEQRLHPHLGLVVPHKPPTKISQGRQWDTQFLVNIGVIFRTFMRDSPGDDFPFPSLRTISRLVVLFLVCAELGSVKEDQVVLTHNRRTITVTGVFQQLRKAHIDNWEGSTL